MSMSDRLNIAMTELGISGRRLASDLGSNVASVSDWKSGKVPIRKPNALAIQALYGLSAEWLLTGEGPMWIARDGAFTLPLYRGLPVFCPDNTIQTEFRCACPFFQTQAEALVSISGYGTTQDLVMYEITEDTMQPTIQLDDWICVNTHPEGRRHVETYRIHVVREREFGPATLRRVALKQATNQLVMLADNHFEPPVTLDMAGRKVEDVILGHVIWHSREMFDNINAQPHIHRPPTVAESRFEAQATALRAAYDARGTALEAAKAELEQLRKQTDQKPLTKGILMPQIPKAKKP